MIDATRRWVRRKEARPGELVAAALQLFSERGFAATRLDDVAAAAGVSKGTVYLYFESKEQLFEAVVRAAVVPNLDRAEALLEGFDGPTPDLLRSLIGLFRPLLDTPITGVIKLIVTESGNFPALARLYADLVLRRGFGLLQRLIARGIARGEFRRVDPSSTAPLIMAPFILLALWKHSFGAHTDLRLDPSEMLATHVEIFLRGLAVVPASRPDASLEPAGPRS
jgi:AcrR family transcriptional regulator